MPVLLRRVIAAGGIALVAAVPVGAQEPVDADIAVTNVGSPAVARVGDVVTFTMVAINNGPDPVALVRLTDAPPVELSDVTWTCGSAGGVTCPVPGGTGIDPIGISFAMPPGGTLTITIVGSLLAFPPAGRVANQVSVDSQDPGFLDSDPSNNFAQAAVPVAALAVAKSAAPPSLGPGDTLTYTLTMTNPGGGVFAGAVVTDDLTGVLDDAMFNDDAVASSGSVSFAEPVLTWTGDVPAGGTVTVTYSVTVNDPPTGDGVLTNGVSGGDCPPESTDPDCTTEVIPTTTTTTTTTTPTDPPPPTDVAPATTLPGTDSTTAATTVPDPDSLPETGSRASLLALGFLLAGSGLLIAAHGSRRTGARR